MTDADKKLVFDEIKKQIEDNPILLYMKGTPEQPQCGFSGRAVKFLQACGHPFTSIDIFKHPDIRTALPEYANFPTFPQLYIKGELIGGSDIIKEMYENGELQPLLDEAFELKLQLDREATEGPVR